MIPARISPEDIEEYECLPNEVKLVVPLYDVESDKFMGLEKRLVFIMARGDQDETFFYMAMIKLKQIRFILPLKKYYLTYLVEPVLKNIKIFCSSNDEARNISLVFLLAVHHRPLSFYKSVYGPCFFTSN